MGDPTYGTCSVRTTPVSCSGAQSPGSDFWHVFGLVICRSSHRWPAASGSGAGCRRTWPVGGTVSILPDHWPGGLAGPREPDIDPLGSRGKWIKVPSQEFGGFKTTLEMKNARAQNGHSCCRMYCRPCGCGNARPRPDDLARGDAFGSENPRSDLDDGLYRPQPRIHDL